MRWPPEGAIDQPDRPAAGLLDNDLRANISVHGDELPVDDQQAHGLNRVHLDTDLGFIGADAGEWPLQSPCRV